MFPYLDSDLLKLLEIGELLQGILKGPLFGLSLSLDDLGNFLALLDCTNFVRRLNN